MTTIPFFQVDAFIAGRPLTGNPAAVMPLDRWLDNSVMQAIAAENNLAETAFTVATDADEADFELRWFTPTLEIGMCGHATLASGHVLMTGERVRFATQSGILTVARAGDLLELDMPAAEVEPTEIPELERRSASPGTPSSAARATAMPSSCSRTRLRSLPCSRISPPWRSCRTWCR